MNNYQQYEVYGDMNLERQGMLPAWFWWMLFPGFWQPPRPPHPPGPWQPPHPPHPPGPWQPPRPPHPPGPWQPMPPGPPPRPMPRDDHSVY